MDKEVQGPVMAVVAAALVAGSVMNYLKVNREERKKRREIENNMVREIKAIRKARDNMTRRILNGDYIETGINGVLEDYKFEKIVARFDEE